MLIWATGMMPQSASPALHFCFSSDFDADSFSSEFNVRCICSKFSMAHTSALHSTCIAAYAHQPCQLCNTEMNAARSRLTARCAFS